MPSYRAEFLTASEIAERDFEANTPEEALELARWFQDRYSDRLNFKFYGGADAIERIQIYDPEAGNLMNSESPPPGLLADWTSPDYRLREAAPDLLAMLIKARDDLNEAGYGRIVLDCEAVIATATGEPTPEGELAAGYEYHSCRVASREGGVENIERCEPEAAEFWTVYRRMEDGRELALFDCVTEDDARAAVAYRRDEIALIEEPAHRQPAALQSPDEEALHRRTLFLLEGLVTMDRLRGMPPVEQEAMELAQAYRNLGFFAQRPEKV